MDPLSSSSPAPTGAQPNLPKPKSQQTAQAFEAVFIGQMTQLMLESVEQGEFSGGHGEAMFRGVMAEQLGTAIAAKGGIGLAPAVMEQIIRLQGGTKDAN